MILTAFFRALSQIGDPRFRRVLILGIGLTVALLFAAYAGVLALIQWLVGSDSALPFIGQVTWLNDLLGWTSLLVMLGLSVFLMVPVASAITSLFLDDVAAAVEERHYPALPPVPRQDWGEALADSLSFLGLLIVANLLALLLYLMFPPAAPFIFWGLNGFLLGREYFQLAAMRRLGRAGAKAMQRRHAATIWLAGTLMAMPLTVPLLNLVIPVLGAATFTHLYHLLARSGEGAIPPGR